MSGFVSFDFVWQAALSAAIHPTVALESKVFAVLIVLITCAPGDEEATVPAAQPVEYPMVPEEAFTE
eukprot:scaffold18111_cov19-Prasinocladus_malaysianus.AAC.1